MFTHACNHQERRITRSGVPSHWGIDVGSGLDQLTMRSPVVKRFCMGRQTFLVGETTIF